MATCELVRERVGTSARRHDAFQSDESDGLTIWLNWMRGMSRKLQHHRFRVCLMS